MPLFLASSMPQKKFARRFMNAQVIALTLSILAGLSLITWARLQLDHLLEVHERATMHVAVEKADGFCGTPAFYIVPKTEGERTDYHVRLDLLGGANRYAHFGRPDAAAQKVIDLPPNRRPGVGLGRGLIDQCERMVLRLSGPFAQAILQSEAHIALAQKQIGAQHQVKLTYAKPENPTDAQAEIQFVLSDVQDLWQFGTKRMRFENQGWRGVNIYLYEEQDYFFLNENLNPLNPPNVPRAYADIHLEGQRNTASLVPGVLSTAHSADVIRKRPTADLELQHELIIISTLFGIGITLFIEGFLILLISTLPRGNKELN